MYNIIDAFLLHLSNQPNGDSITFDRYSTDGINAFNTMLEKGLITGRGYGMQFIHDITPLGRKIVNQGGYQVYIEKIEAHQETVSMLEFRKLTSEVAKLKIDIPNSEQLNRRDTINKIIAIGALIISFIALIYTILKQ